jgi:ABC-type multidrug transport system ATPase subunit
MREIIAARGLAKSYGEVKAVDGLDLSIREGEFFGFLGPNGAGKTTTIRILTGIIRPNHGEVTIDGFTPQEKRKIGRIIGVVPESRGFYDWMTGEEYLDFFAALYGIRKDEREERISTLLSDTGLLSARNRTIGAYSRGMRQRLGLARALINGPKILFLDEPTLGLDPQGQEDIQHLLTKMNRQGVTIFLSSHQLHEVENLCSTIAIIDNGRLVAQGTIDQLRQKTGMSETYYIRIKGSGAILSTREFSPQIDTVKEGRDSTDFIFHGTSKGANTLLDKLRQEKIPVLEFRTQRESLTDIFLNLTPKS